MSTLEHRLHSLTLLITLNLAFIHSTLLLTSEPRFQSQYINMIFSLAFIHNLYFPTSLHISPVILPYFL